ncbi:MAG: hypothetical protein JSV03_13420 [Planctomycetota bacterium]|nr:MAG: hypothetical protein JSV03_13420 [Planctomycetota bacterium]
MMITAETQHEQFITNYVISEEDEWKILSANQINVSSKMFFKKLPDTY